MLQTVCMTLDTLVKQFSTMILRLACEDMILELASETELQRSY